MRFFTSISIAALCFVATIQAAPGGLPVNLPGTDAATSQLTGLTGNLPLVNQLGGLAGGGGGGGTQNPPQGSGFTTQGEADDYPIGGSNVPKGHPGPGAGDIDSTHDLADATT
ncbi:predicted protein [Lichtheimia corymbifera JMRC:FSU:9682]|uniref:Uncharacterized protein n=1 Tax=Lichtheimia corymbifera JMRC:FSU:9682 TaxID=1263082 RepID=A0A068RH36_9FUNG|nr:predicted protein [Lichtheimia corymbifera JMRC:FSU:9682]